MGNNRAKGRTSARRAAAFLGVLGALVMSSGIALMVAATPANAAQDQHVPVGICHATSSDTNPYVFITVDDDSAKFKGHLMHRNSPNKHWKSDGTFEGVDHAAGDPKPDFISDFTDTNGVFHKYDGDITSASCDDTGDVILPAVADVDFNDPTCASPNSGTVDTTGQHADFTVTPLKDSYSVGDVVTVDATATDESSFEEGAQTHWEHTFVASDAPCPSTVVTPPTPSQVEGTTVVSPPKAHVKAKTHAAAVTPTVVHAGLTSVSAQDMRGEQGLALMVAGMVMLAGAGGLGLRIRAASRI
jgi:hypothetical protein